MTLKTAPADVATQVDHAGEEWVRLADVAKILAHLKPAKPAAEVVWLDTAEAAERVGKHRDTVATALRDGSLHGHQRRWHGPWIVHPAVLDAWVGEKSEGEQKALCAACTPAEPVRGRAGAR